MNQEEIDALADLAKVANPNNAGKFRDTTAHNHH